MNGEEAAPRPGVERTADGSGRVGAAAGSGDAGRREVEAGETEGAAVVQADVEGVGNGGDAGGRVLGRGAAGGGRLHVPEPDADRHAEQRRGGSAACAAVPPSSPSPPSQSKPLRARTIPVRFRSSAG